MIDILKENNFKKFAEIGVWKSELCTKILSDVGNQIEEYWAVDPWEVKHAGSQVQRRRSPEKWLEMHRYCCSLMMYFPQLKVAKMTSEQAHTMFPDEYFDMVFIDAVHTFEEVSADIGYWLPKVREGGIISGHDYGGRKPGVKEAVDKWFGEGSFDVIEVTGTWLKRV